MIFFIFHDFFLDIRKCASFNFKGKNILVFIIYLKRKNTIFYCSNILASLIFVICNRKETRPRQPYETNKGENMVLSNCLFFQVCDNNIGLFYINLFKLIALNLLCIFSWLLTSNYRNSNSLNCNNYMEWRAIQKRSHEAMYIRRKYYCYHQNPKSFLLPFKIGNFYNIAIVILEFSLLLPF